jgi:hypothetical protein
MAAAKELEHIHAHIESLVQLLSEVRAILDARLPPMGPPGA